jgi:hypothetical protein
MKRIAHVFAGAVLLTLVFATPAFAQYPPEEPTGEVSDSTVTPCQTITVSGSNWEAGSTVDISLDGASLGSASVGPGGNFSTSVQIPCNLSPGTYALVLSGTDADGNPATVTSMITVLAGVTTAGTGANLGAGLGLLGVLLILGIGALFISRRRKGEPQEVRVPSP